MKLSLDLEGAQHPPSMMGKKQFATVSLAKNNTRQRRPSTVKLFSNAPNPFAEAASPGSSSPSPSAPAPARDDSALKSLAVSSENATGAADELKLYNHHHHHHLHHHQDEHALHLGAEQTHLSAFRAREPQLGRMASAQQPFQFATQAELLSHAQGFRPRSEDERIHPEQWEQMSASYNDWELGMLYKLAKVAELLLTPDAALTNQQRLEERLNEIARQDASERPARPAPAPRKSTVLEKDSVEESTLHPAKSEDGGSKKRSPRSPESQRKSFGTWSAKVAAAKKKSLERKKGADTLSMMRAEDGSELAESVTSMDKSLFGIWNRDGTAASSAAASRGGTPVSSPALTRKTSSLSAAEDGVLERKPTRSGSQIKRQAASDETQDSSAASALFASSGSEKATSSSGSGKEARRASPTSLLEQMGSSTGSLPTVKDSGGSGKKETSPSTPTNSRRSNVFTKREKRSSSRLDEDESESAFPGLSLRSSDAAAFLELLKSDKQRKEGGDPEAEEVRSKETKEPRSASSSPEASSPELNRSPKGVLTSPAKDAASSAAPATQKRSPGVRASGEVGMKLSFLRPGQRSSVKTSKSELAAAGIPQSAVSPTSVAPSSSSASAVSPKNEVPPLAVGQATTEQPQKSPKNKRFSMVFSRRADSPTLSPRNTGPSDTSPRKSTSPGNMLRAKVSPRKDNRSSTPVFGRRKASPRGEDVSTVAPEPVLASPPLSARELVADASTLAALDTFLQEES